MTKPRTLNDLKQLKESGFGRPYPRHGLKLLYWFAKEHLYFDDYNRMCWRCRPEYEDYGFHRFENRRDQNGEKLLPDVNLEYYEVGNLNRRKEGAKKLQPYVREDYAEERGDSNKDRIIVSINVQWVKKVYVTEHINQAEFNKEATYCISERLIMMIRDLKLNEFLSVTGYSGLNEDTDRESGYSTPQNNTTKSGHCSIWIADPHQDDVNSLPKNNNNNNIKKWYNSCTIL